MVTTVVPSLCLTLAIYLISLGHSLAADSKKLCMWKQNAAQKFTSDTRRSC